MAGASVSGLGSGLDTATIIDQFMQLEAISQTRLKSRVTTEQSTVKTLQDLNTKVAALATRAADLVKPASWTPLTATSSSEHVTLSATSGVSAGDFSFTVDQTALAHRLTFAGTAALTDVVVPADAEGNRTVTLTVNGEPRTIDTGDGTLGGLVNALNAGGTGLRASSLKLDDGTYRLSVQSATTGAASAFTLTAADGTDLLTGATVTQGRDAKITIGADQVSSASNTFAGVVPGVDLTVSNAAVGSTVDVNVTSDPTKVTADMKAFVDAVNSALADIDRLTAYNATTKTAGALAGDTGVRSLRTALLDAVYPPGGGSLADVGVQTDRYGKLVFDEDRFQAAYVADPAAVTEKLAGGGAGFVDRISAVATTASDKYDGTLTASITGRTSSIERLTDSIEQWDIRLELRRTTLTRQFTAMETAMSQISSQSNWLAGQISGLSGNTGS